MSSMNSRTLVIACVFVLLSIVLAAFFVVMWPKPMSIIVAGMSLLCGFGALLVFCRKAGGIYALQARMAIFLTSVCFGLAFVGLAWKYQKTEPALSSASLIAVALLCLGALATFFITRGASRIA
jgi:hypothetical protein